MTVSSSLKTVGIDHVVLHVGRHGAVQGLLHRPAGNVRSSRGRRSTPSSIVESRSSPCSRRLPEHRLRRAWSSTTSHSGWTAASVPR